MGCHIKISFKKATGPLYYGPVALFAVSQSIRSSVSLSKKRNFS